MGWRVSGKPKGLSCREDVLSAKELDMLFMACHSTLEMTRHYAEVSDSDVETKQKAFSPAEKHGVRV